MDTATVLLLGVLLFAAIVMSIASFVTHRGSVAFVSVLFWLVVVIWNFIEAAGTWNIYMILGFAGIVMMIVMPIEAMFLNKGEEAAGDKLQEASAMQAALDEMDAKNKAIAEKRMKELL
jgi:low affinity Fe/Cu permease